MRAILACRDSPGARILAGNLHREGLLAGLLLESGRRASTRRVRQLLKDGIQRLPALTLQLALLLIYRTLTARTLEQDAPGQWPEVPSVRVHDINESAAVDFLTAMQGDLLVTFGTAIVREPVVSTFQPIVNVHFGIVPRYRNVHGDAWALYHRDTPGLGISLLRLTPGIDDGPVIAQESLQQPIPECIFTAKRRLAALAGTLLVRTLHQGSLSGTPQVGEVQRCTTPTAGVLLTLILRSAHARFLPRGISRN